jgi:hypothetical protein
MSYLNLVQTTAHTAYETWYECSVRACQDTATVWDWYYATFIGPEAVQRYQVAGDILARAIYITILLGAITRVVLQDWSDRIVADALNDDLPQLDELMDAAAALVEKPVPAMAADMGSSASVLVVPADDGPDYAGMTSHALRKECENMGIKWRHAHSRDKHLSKPEMVAELLLMANL